MFAYCENNPVKGCDPTGELPLFVVGAIVGIGEQFAADIFSNVVNHKPLDNFSSVGTYVSAAISGAFSTLPGGTFVTTIARDVISETAGLCVDAAINSKSSSPTKLIKDIVSTAADHTLSSKGDSWATKIGKCYTGNNKSIKAGIKFAQSAVRTVTKYSSAVAKFFGSLF